MVGGSTGCAQLIPIAREFPAPDKSCGRASVTAITMTFEMTRDYSTILPIIITTVLAHMTRKAISEDSIYTLKLVRRGHVVPEGLQAAVHAAQRVQDVMTKDFRVVGRQEAMTRYDGVTLVLDDAHSGAAREFGQGTQQSPLHEEGRAFSPRSPFANVPVINPHEHEASTGWANRAVRQMLEGAARSARSAHQYF